MDQSRAQVPRIFYFADGVRFPGKVTEAALVYSGAVTLPLFARSSSSSRFKEIKS